ncbi:TRAP transporter small permease [Vandammella animalimorsus]|uniref:TRAP transporter small permease n=1 Tax=Vandammella animalimorsus TaxID=2029117 RepID=UPI00325B6E20
MNQDLPDIPLVHARGLVRVAEWLLDAVCVAALALLSGITSVDVVGRYVFNAPLQGAYESSELLLAVLVFAALPRVTWHRQHLAVGMIDGLLGHAGRRIQRVAVALVSALVLGTLAYYLWLHAAQLASYGDMSNALQLPIAPFAYAAACLSALAALAALLGLFVHAPGAPVQQQAAAPAGQKG